MNARPRSAGPGRCGDCEAPGSPRCTPGAWGTAWRRMAADVEGAATPGARTRGRRTPAALPWRTTEDAAVAGADARSWGMAEPPNVQRAQAPRTAHARKRMRGCLWGLRSGGAMGWQAERPGWVACLQ